MRALVLSGGGFFGAWQAGAWAALAESFQPDLIVGASVGSLNGYAIACGAAPDYLRELWLDEEVVRLSRFRQNLLTLAVPHRPRMDFALVVTDLLRMKPRIFRGDEVTWQHLAASCAIPLVLPQIRIEGRYYSDGGLLNPLPVYAAVELGATEILALNVLPEVPSNLLKPAVAVFRAMFGFHPPLSNGVKLAVLKPSRRLGSALDAIRFKRRNIERWLEEGYQDAKGYENGRKGVSQETF